MLTRDVPPAFAPLLDPSKPMIDGSRWCSCGIALNKWVISRAPRSTAAVAVGVGAILVKKRRESMHFKSFASHKVRETKKGSGHMGWKADQSRRQCRRGWVV